MRRQLVARSSYLDGTLDRRWETCFRCGAAFRWWSLWRAVYCREPHNEETLLHGRRHLFCRYDGTEKR